LVLKAYKELQVQLDNQSQAQPAVREALERLAQLEPQDLLEAQALQARQDPQVLLDLQVLLAAQGLLDQLGQQE
jgi:hypothetical protein